MSMQKHTCTACHASKLRYSLDTFAKHGKCRRCFKIEAERVFKSMVPRQRRKRTDTRAAALERQATQLQAAVGSARESRRDDARHYDDDQVDGHVHDAAHAFRSSSQRGDTGAVSRRTVMWHGNETSIDDDPAESRLERLFTSGLITVNVARSLFDDFVNYVVLQ